MQINTVFSIFIAMGAGLGLYQVFRLAPARQALPRLDAAVWVLLAGLIGARTGFVLLNGHIYAGSPLQALQIGNGGLRWEGALLAALLALALAANRFHLAFAELADASAHLLPPLAVAGWLGCWLVGCGCAPAVSGQISGATPLGTMPLGTMPLGTMPLGTTPLWAIASPDETGLVAARFPLQPAAALALALAFFLAQWLTGPKSRPGLLAGRFGLALGTNLLFFSFFNAESAPLWHGWRVSAWGAAVLALLSLAGIVAVRLGGRAPRSENSSPQPGERAVHSRT